MCTLEDFAQVILHRKMHLLSTDHALFSIDYRHCAMLLRQIFALPGGKSSISAAVILEKENLREQNFSWVTPFLESSVHGKINTCPPYFYKISTDMNLLSKLGQSSFNSTL